MTTSGLSVLQNLLPIIAENFRSLSTLALLRRTCKDVYNNTKDYSLVYRVVLQNTGWMNKTHGKQAFVLSQHDVRLANYIDCSKLGYLLRLINGFPRGHLVTRRMLFALSLAKHGSVDGICRAHVKREHRRAIHHSKRLTRNTIQMLIPTTEPILGQLSGVS
jgi:hypothetical protein